MNLGLPRWVSSKESACHAQDAGHLGSIPGWGRFPEGGHGNPLQYSCQEYPMDRGAWQTVVREVTKGLYTTEATEHTHVFKGLPGGSKGKESACNEGDLG